MHSPCGAERTSIHVGGSQNNCCAMGCAWDVMYWGSQHDEVIHPSMHGFAHKHVWPRQPPQSATVVL
eukprot:1350638-Karenia_brevis.AAC.1